MLQLNRTQLKYLAALAMLIDHIGAFFIPVTTPLGALCRIIGRLTAPIMCWFLAEGYEYTRSKSRYALRLFIFALVSQPFYAYAHNNTILEADFNMIFTLFLSFVMLLCYEKIREDFLKFLSVAAIICLSYFCDWGITAPLWVLGFYLYKNSRKKKLIYFSAVTLFWIARVTYNCIDIGYYWYGEWCQLGLFLFPLVSLLYNGQKGSNSKFSKWFFYIFYPLHLFVLAAVKNLGIFDII